MNSLISKFMATWLHPWDAMQSVKQEGETASIVPSMVFIVVIGLLSGVITSILGMFLPAAAVPGASKAAVWLAVIVVPVVSFIGSFIGAFIIWALVDGVLKGTTPQYKTAYRLLALLAAFSPVSALLSPIPKVGQYLAIAVNIWATIVMIRGIIIVRDTPPVRTWVTCGILFAFLFTLGIFARMAAQRQFQNGGFGDLGPATGAPADDLGTASDNLEKQLQDLADKAKTDQQTPPETSKK
jgi:hypothetical protein